jgi:hypothetical protein
MKRLAKDNNLTCHNSSTPEPKGRQIHSVSSDPLCLGGGLALLNSHVERYFDGEEEFTSVATGFHGDSSSSDAEWRWHVVCIRGCLV